MLPWPFAAHATARVLSLCNRTCLCMFDERIFFMHSHVHQCGATFASSRGVFGAILIAALHVEAGVCARGPGLVFQPKSHGPAGPTSCGDLSAKRAARMPTSPHQCRCACSGSDAAVGVIGSYGVVWPAWAVLSRCGLALAQPTHAFEKASSAGSMARTMAARGVELPKLASAR